MTFAELIEKLNVDNLFIYNETADEHYWYVFAPEQLGGNDFLLEGVETSLLIAEDASLDNLQFIEHNLTFEVVSDVGKVELYVQERIAPKI